MEMSILLGASSVFDTDILICFIQASDMINAILEGYPKSKREFLDEVGVETDEDCKVLIPDS